MTYLLIIFVVALALAPLTHFVPSKAQRRIAGIREFAALEGLYVEFRSVPPGVLSSSEAAAHQHGRTIYYGLRIPSGNRTLREFKAWVYGEQGWRCLPRGGYIPEALNDLPPNIFAASIDQESCGIYWQERGEEADIVTIKQVLFRLLSENDF